MAPKGFDGKIKKNPKKAFRRGLKWITSGTHNGMKCKKIQAATSSGQYRDSEAKAALYFYPPRIQPIPI